MKKRIALLLAVAMLFGLSACGEGRDYKKAVAAYESGSYEEARAIFEALGDYEDSAEQAKKCLYQQARRDYENGDYDSAVAVFTSMIDYEDCAELAKGCVFHKAVAAYEGGYTKEAVEALCKIFDYPGAREQLCQIMFDLIQNDYIPEITGANDSLSAYSVTWTKQFKTNYNKTKVGQNIPIPEVDEKDADVVSMRRHMEKAGRFAASFDEIFSDELLALCDEEMRGFKQTFLSSHETFDNFFKYPDSYFQMVMFYATTNQSTSKALYKYNEAIYAIMDATEALVGKTG